MTADQIIKSLKKKDLAPVYFLGGEEAFYIDKVIKVAETELLDEGEKAFNQIILYGKEVNFKQVVDNARQFPMMASNRVVILKEAQAMRDFDKLETYLKQPAPQTSLFISYKHKKPDGRKAIFKILKKQAVYLDASKIKDYKLAEWISGYVSQIGLTISTKSSQLLAEYLGNDLQKIENEVSKATIHLAKDAEITEELIQEKIGISKEFNVFELQKAIGSKQSARVLKITDNMANNIKNNSIPAVSSSLYRYFTQLFVAAQHQQASDGELAGKLRINPYFIKEIRQAARSFSSDQFVHIFQLLKRYDLKSKGVNNRQTTAPDLLRELVYRILYV